MDWDKLRIFHAAAKAGSFTHAGESLGLSQSAVSRQVSALESELQAPLFHRHARGLILTEQGDVLYRTVQEVMTKLDAVQTRLSDNRDKPHGELRITTTLGIGTNWLTPRLGEFLELYPDVTVKLILSDEELDLGMREADVALRLREPSQPDLVRRRLATDDDEERVERDANSAKEAGIDGVPCFIFGDRVAVQGAQAPEHLAQAIQRAANDYAKGEAAE